VDVELVARSEWPEDFWLHWDRLNREYCGNHPLLQSRFVEPLVRYFAPDNLVAAVSSKGRDAGGILLLQPSGHHAGTVRTAFLPAQAQIALIQPGPEPARFLNNCLQALPITTLRLDLLAVDTKYQASICRILNTTHTSRGVDMSISLSGDFEEYWKKRPRNLRKNINRYNNKVERELGELNLIVRHKEDLPLAVDRYGFLESRGWKGTEGTALHPGNAQGQFYREILASFGATDDGLAFELWNEGRMLASRLCIRNKAQIIILKTTFDETARGFAPGWLLLQRIVRQLFNEHENSSLEFYTNASKEQLEWCTEFRETINLSGYRLPLVQKLEGIARHLDMKGAFRL
jgi:hypothetical protein